jgi:hypothetical protein
MRVTLACVLASAALLATGCGGSSSGGASGGAADTASLAPKDAGVWVAIDTDRSSGQWQALDALLAAVPGAETLVNDAIAQVGPTGGAKLDFQRDIQPALGKQVVLVLPAGASTPVVLVQPADDAKFKKLLAGDASPPVTGTQDGWTVVAETQKALDGYKASLTGDTLADSDTFGRAMEGLPSEALASVYVDGKGLVGAAGSATDAATSALRTINASGSAGSALPSSAPIDPKTLEQLGAFGLTVSAGDHVLRLDGSLESTNGVEPVSFTPTLLRQVPSDALAALSFSGSAAMTDQVTKALSGAGAAAADAIKQLPDTLGVTLDQLLAVSDGQGVAYVRPGLIIPEVTVVLEPKDPAAAVATLSTVAAKLAGKAGGKIGKATVGGRTFEQVTVSVISVSWGRDGDKVVITTSPAAIDDFDGTGAKLVDTDRFKAAAADVHLGDETAGFAYVDVKKLTPLVTTLASAAGGAASDPSLKKVTAALSAIDTVVIGSSADGSRSHVEAVVRVP